MNIVKIHLCFVSGGALGDASLLVEFVQETPFVFNISFHG
jgi:hypothetical protein